MQGCEKAFQQEGQERGGQMIPSILMMPIRSAGCQIRICEHQINFFLWTAGSYKLYCSVSGLNCRGDHDLPGHAYPSRSKIMTMLLGSLTHTRNTSNNKVFRSIFPTALAKDFRACRLLGFKWTRTNIHKVCHISLTEFGRSHIYLTI